MWLKLLRYRGYILQSSDSYLTMYSVGWPLTETSNLLFAGNINLPVNTMSRRHHPVRTDDWTATSETIPVLKRYLQALLLRHFTGKYDVCRENGFLIVWEKSELMKSFLYVENRSFTWYGKSSMFTGTPPTIRPSRRGRARGVTAPEKIIYLWPNLQGYLLLL